MANANLLVTYDPSHTSSAKSEVMAMLKEVGEKPSFLKSNVDGVFLIKTKKKPKELTKKLSAACKKNPDKFSYTYHWSPVDKWCGANIAAMTRVMKSIDKKMPSTTKWKMDLSKRGFDKYSTPELIAKLTEHIKKKNVDLNNPKAIVKVDVVKNKAAISLLSAEELLDVMRFKKK